MLLDIRCKIIIENIGEILRQEIVDDNSYIGGKQFAFIGSCELGFLSRFDFPIVQRQHTIFPLRSFPIALLDIFALLYGRNGWCIGRRPTDTQFFQFTNQTGLGIAGGSLRETFRCRDRRQCQHIAFRQCRQHLVVSFCIAFVIGRLHIHFQETVEFQDLAHGDEVFFPSRNGDGRSRLFQLGITHLRSDRTFPNQFIQSFFLRGSIDFVMADVRGTYCLVRFLCSFGMRMVISNMQISLAQSFYNLVFGRIYSQR